MRGVANQVCILGSPGGDLRVQLSGVWAVVCILGGPGGDLGVQLWGYGLSFAFGAGKMKLAFVFEAIGRVFSSCEFRFVLTKGGG